MIEKAREHAGRRPPRSRTRGSGTPVATARAAGAIHINPSTGLATDYLDHFNQAVMLLELVAATPDCADDFHAWRPRSYQDYFQSVPSPAGLAALAGYGAADPLVRARLDTLTASMTDVLVATQEVMQSTPSSPALGMLANRAALWVSKLVTQARAVIEGTDQGGGATKHASPARGRAGRRGRDR
jgi:hypothetical protein